MIYSKANLEVVQLAHKDPRQRNLNGVKFESDGSTVATNGRTLLAVSPVQEEVQKGFPTNVVEQIDPGNYGVLMPVEVVEKALKGLPRDKRTGLQHAAMSRVEDPGRVGFTSIDAKGDPTTVAALPKIEVFPAWRRIVKERITGGGAGTTRGCFNRKDLLELLKAMESACPNKGDINPIYVEMSNDGSGMVLRCPNYETGQHAVGVVGAFDTKGSWLPFDKWERKLFRLLPPKIQRKE